MLSSMAGWLAVRRTGGCVDYIGANWCPNRLEHCGEDADLLSGPLELKRFRGDETALVTEVQSENHFRIHLIR